MTTISPDTVRQLKAASQPDLIMKRALYPLLSAAFSLLQILIPAKHNRICYMSRPDFADNAYYMYRRLLNSDAPLEHIWIVEKASVKTRIEADFAREGRDDHHLKVLVRRSPAAIWHCLRSRVVLHTHGTFGFYRKAWRRQVICLWHGMPIKCIGSLNKVTPNCFPTFGTQHIASSDFFRYVIAVAFKVPIEKVLGCGLPRCDVLSGSMAPSCTAIEAKRALGLPPDDGLILWMPTYRTELHGPNTDRPRSFLDDLPDGLMAALDEHCRLQSMQVVIKLHPYDLLNHTDNPLPFQRIRLLKSEQFEKLGIAMYDLLSHSEALMSDISSVVIDYLVTGRPIAIIGFDKDTYTRDVVFPPENLLSCRNIARIADAGAWPAFFRRIGSTIDVATPDAAHIFSVPPQQTPATEAIAQACGLEMARPTAASTEI